MTAQRSIGQRRRARRRAAEAPQQTSEQRMAPEGAAQSAELLRDPQAGHAARGAAAVHLRHVLGNSAVDRLLNAGPGAVARQSAPPAADPLLEAFRKQTFHRDNHHPSTGRGLFDVDYVPGTGDLTITVKVHFDFKAGDPTTLPAAEQANYAGLSASAFQWTADESDAWATNAIGDVQAAWGERFTFHTTKPGWESLPNVKVHVNVVQAPADKAHYVTTVNKWPKDASVRDEVTPPGAADKKSTAHFEERSDDDGIKNPDNDQYTRRVTDHAEYQKVRDKNPQQVFFTIGKSEMKADDQTKLQDFAKELAKPGIPPFPITVTGHASSDGAATRNQVLSEERAHVVSNEIVGGGAKKQPTVDPKGATGPGAGSRRADIVIQPLQSQQETVVHEFGHMFGLADEYAEAGRRAPGAATGHSALVAKLMPEQQAVVAEDNENIMSTGETIKPHHYVTFIEALGQVSGMEGQWQVGPGAGSKGPGDFPAPGGKTDVA